MWPPHPTSRTQGPLTNSASRIARGIIGRSSAIPCALSGDSCLPEEPTAVLLSIDDAILRRGLERSRGPELPDPNLQSSVWPPRPCFPGLGNPRKSPSGLVRAHPHRIQAPPCRLSDVEADRRQLRLRRLWQPREHPD